MGEVIWMDIAAYRLRETQMEALAVLQSLDTTSPTYPQDFIQAHDRCMAAHRRAEKAEYQLQELLR